MSSFFFMKLCIFLIFLVGCVSPQKNQNTLRVCLAKDPTTFDPRKSGDFVSSTLICLLFEGLMRCNEGSKLDPGIAETIEISQDKKTYTFHLRKAKWSDGQQVTAKDFETSWKSILTPGFPAPCAYLLYPIKNAEKRAKNLCQENEVGIVALDDFTLQVKLEAPTPHFLSLTAFPLLLPYPTHTNEFVCNGPFIIENVVVGSEILLQKNKAFWAQKQILLDKIHLSVIPDEMTAINLFEKGELDIIGGPLNPVPLDVLPKSLEQNVKQMTMEASTFCALNTNSLPFSNQLIRKAFALALLNHPMLISVIQEAKQIPAKHILPPHLEPGPRRTDQRGRKRNTKAWH